MLTHVMKTLSEKASIDRVSTDQVIGADAAASIKARISYHAASHLFLSTQDGASLYLIGMSFHLFSARLAPEGDLNDYEHINCLEIAMQDQMQKLLYISMHLMVDTKKL